MPGEREEQRKDAARSLSPNEAPETGTTAGATQEGDWRGPYGYGHRAHQPDPSAHYGFAPQPERLLPPSKPGPRAPEHIWKRPLR